jgi:hypothetical protein
MLGSHCSADIYRVAFNDSSMTSRPRVRVLVHSWLSLLSISAVVKAYRICHTLIAAIDQ